MSVVSDNACGRVVENAIAVIHIGTGKTGSTSIQKTLHSSRRALRSAGVVYPTIGDQWDHQALAAAFCYKEFRAMKARVHASGMTSDAFYKSEVSNFVEAVRGTNLIVLSAEYFSSFRQEDVHRFKSFLISLGFKKFFILAYFRPPDSYYSSFVQQQLKASPNYDSPSSFRYDIKKISEMWLNNFPQCTYKKFSRDTLYGGDVVLDFLHWMESEVGVCSLIDKVRVKNLNTSLSLEAMVYLERFWRSLVAENDDEFYEVKSKVLRAVKEADKLCVITTPKLSRSAKDYINRSHIGDIDSFNSKSEDKMELPSTAGDGNVTFENDITKIFEGFSEVRYQKYKLFVDSRLENC